MSRDSDGIARPVVAAYRLLLRLYPASHREQFGVHMDQLFRDGLRDALAQHSAPVLVRFAAGSVVDAVNAAATERIHSMRTLQLLLLPLSLFAGYLIFRVDSRPNWDDTGITAGALLLTAGVFAFFLPRFAWLWALTVGAWLPVAYFLRNGDPRFFFIFVIPVIGALVGAGGRKLLSLALRPA